jgi:hypothetical protein
MNITDRSNLIAPKIIIEGLELSYENFQKECEEKSKPLLNCSEEYEVWYHATGLNCALDILRNGIILNVNQPFLDFGHNPSFYLTQDLSHAVQWAIYKYHKNPAILIFKVMKEDRYTLDLKILQDEEWRLVVKNSRQTGLLKPRPPPHPLVLLVDQQDLILGFEVSRPVEEAKRKEWIPEPDNPPVNQLAIKNKGVHLFNQSVTGLIFALL